MGWNTGLTLPEDLAIEASPGAIETAAEAARTAAEYVEGIAPWYANRDAYIWPGIAGESFAPTLAGGYAYNTLLGRACYHINPGVASGTANANFPLIPRLVTPTKPVMVISFFLLVVDVGVANGRLQFSYGESSTWSAIQRAVRIGLLGGAAAPIQFQTSDGTAAQTTSLAAPTLNTWTAYELRLKETSVECYRSGALVATHSTRFFPSTVGDATRPVLIKPGDAGVDEAPQHALAGLEITWEAT